MAHRLETSVLEELWSIWRADPRVPSIRSRRSWAISRNASPRLVDSWFLRRKTCAKKAGQPIQDGTYDLPLERDPPSDDTLVSEPDTVFGDDSDSAYKDVLSPSCADQDILASEKITSFVRTQDTPDPGLRDITPWELSAIPFLLRTPATVSPDNATNLCDWTTVEDELERLVGDGKLDFSFLGDPFLVSLELTD